VCRILVHSTANAAAQQAARARRLQQAGEELDKLQHSCGGRYYSTAEKVIARIGVIVRKRRIASCLVTDTGTGTVGRPTLTWHFDQGTLARQAAADDWYALLSTLEPTEADAAEVLIRYKDQPMVERRYSQQGQADHGDQSGDPAVVLQEHRGHGERAVEFCLIERQVRQVLGGNQTMCGLYPDNRAVRPTGRIILYHLASLRMRVKTAIGPPAILINRGAQAHLLELFSVDETRPRWLDT
jgi:hypothetical protein